MIDSSVEAMVRRLPESADLVRHRFSCDVEFRTVCDDYRDVIGILAKRERVRAPNRERTEGYRQLAAQLLADATAMLEESIEIATQ